MPTPEDLPTADEVDDYFHALESEDDEDECCSDNAEDGTREEI